MKGSVKEPNMFHNYETEKITLGCWFVGGDDLTGALHNL